MRAPLPPGRSHTCRRVASSSIVRAASSPSTDARKSPTLIAEISTVVSPASAAFAESTNPSCTSSETAPSPHGSRRPYEAPVSTRPTLNLAAVSCTIVSSDMIHSAPSSTIAPFVRVTDQTRPPTRSRASRTVTPTPRSASDRAAERPANPAPTTIALRCVCISVGVRTDYRLMVHMGDTCMARCAYGTERTRR